MSTPSNLVDIMDQFYMELMAEARATRPGGDDDLESSGAPKVSFGDRLKLFSEGRAWVAVKNKVAPEEESDAFSDARAKLVGGVRRGGPPAKAPNGHG